MSDDTMPVHPASRAVHAILNSAQIARGLATPGDDGGSYEEDGERIVALLTEAAADVAALQQHVDALDADLRGLRDQGLADAREISRLRDANEGLNAQLRELNARIAATHRDVEHLYVGAAMDLDRHTERFNAVRRIRDRLDAGAAVREARAITHTEPRTAAAGAWPS